MYEGSLTIWILSNTDVASLSVSLPQLTSLKRPLVVIHDLFDKSIMDISWWVFRRVRHGLPHMCIGFSRWVGWLCLNVSSSILYSTVLVLTLMNRIKTSLVHPSASLSLVCVFVCQDSEWSRDVGVFDGRHSGLLGLLTGWTGRPAERGGEG